jgi:hypothetical protein
VVVVGRAFEIWTHTTTASETHTIQHAAYGLKRDLAVDFFVVVLAQARAAAEHDATTRQEMAEIEAMMAEEAANATDGADWYYLVPGQIWSTGTLHRSPPPPFHLLVE